MKKLDRKFVNKVVQIAKEAGLIVMQIYNKPFTFQRKRDSSPVTKADLLSEKFISSSLQARQKNRKTNVLQVFTMF